MNGLHSINDPLCSISAFVLKFSLLSYIIDDKSVHESMRIAFYMSTNNIKSTTESRYIT